MGTAFADRVAAEVRVALVRADKTKSQLASILGVSRPTAAARWSGALPYSLDELAVLADELGVPVSTFVPQSPEGVYAK